MIPGMLVFHEQLGIGKILEKKGDHLSVAFLFYWPTVLVSAEQVRPYVPSQLFRDFVNQVPQLESLK